MLVLETMTLTDLDVVYEYAIKMATNCSDYEKIKDPSEREKEKAQYDSWFDLAQRTTKVRDNRIELIRLLEE